MSRAGSVWSHVRERLVRGLLLVLPAVVTVWLLNILFGIVRDNVTPWLFAILRAVGLGRLEGLHARLTVPVAGIVLTLLVIYLVGLLGANLVGRRILAAFESGILRVPFVKGIYGAARQLLDAFNATSAGGFSRVVLVEYPRREMWTVGFVTNERSVDSGAARDLFVFLPTTPNPTSGWLVLVPAKDVVDLAMTVEEGVKLVVSGGIVLPPGILRAEIPEHRTPDPGR